MINWGANRWGFKPEFGYSQRWAKWVLDGYMRVWRFNSNNDFWSHNSFYPGTRSQSQAPIGSFEGYLSYDVKPRLWASLDRSYRFGGKTRMNGVQTPLIQESNSRLGGMVSVPISKRQSLKFSYNNGTTSGSAATTRASRLPGNIPRWGNRSSRVSCIEARMSAPVCSSLGRVDFYGVSR
jgi:hypothetical protein